MRPFIILTIFILGFGSQQRTAEANKSTRFSKARGPVATRVLRALRYRKLTPAQLLRQTRNGREVALGSIKVSQMTPKRLVATFEGKSGTGRLEFTGAENGFVPLNEVSISPKKRIGRLTQYAKGKVFSRHVLRRTADGLRMTKTTEDNPRGQEASVFAVRDILYVMVGGKMYRRDQWEGGNTISRDMLTHSASMFGALRQAIRQGDFEPPRPRGVWDD